jgi:murein DD-endopeptidase MepM/ murein hydrolase activator NlpD
MGGYGNIVVIDHGDGMTTRYAHQTSLAASVAQTVRPGDQIGHVGSTGNVTGPHLHFEVRVNDQPQDPMAYLP